MNKHCYVVIMAGGSGTRLWPLSRQKSPKQFHRLTGKRSLFQETFRRVKKVLPEKNILVSLGQKDLKLARKQLPLIPRKNFIIEPVSRNTGPAIGLSALIIYQRDPEALVATLASDHEVQKPENFVKSLKLAFQTIKDHPQSLMTIGLQPSYPETGYGYIKLGQKFSPEIFRMERFVEKPDPKTAQKYFDSGQYLWNASYFIFKASQMLGWYKKHSVLISRLLNKISQQNCATKATKEIFGRMPNEPIDTALVEKLDQVLVIPADLGWSDVGSWQSVYQVLKDKLGLSEIIQGQHIGYQDKDIFVLGHKRMIATVGLKNIAIIDTPDVILVINKNQAQDVKKVIEKVEKKYL